MHNLIQNIVSVKPKIENIVKLRIKEFRENRKNQKSLFKELCFCILTANYSAEKAIRIQQVIDDGFLDLSYYRLREKLKELGYRYPNIRARYIVEARKHYHELPKIIRKKERREWLVKHVKGIGMKEASHFLRNIGFFDYAIIDFQILNILKKHQFDIPKKLTKTTYIEIENILKKLGDKLNLKVGILDLYLWYLETNKVLK